MEIDPKSVWVDLQAIRKSSPLIHNITNYVAMEQTANGLLAIGASPVMAHALNEVKEMTRSARALVLNIGTLSPLWVEGMRQALSAANAKEIPVVFDPVGLGATSYRTQTAHALLNHGAITVIRGNASEIVHFMSSQGNTKGVDSCLDASRCFEHAKALALKQKCVVWMSGKTDVVTDGTQVSFVHHGHPLMAKVTGMGCTATAITGAFLSVNPHPFQGCLHAALIMGIAGERAAKQAQGPGSFKSAFFDILYTVSECEIKEAICVETP